MPIGTGNCFEKGGRRRKDVEETIASLKRKSAPRERAKKQYDEIVRVLTECKGRVGRADGAAVRMGLSRTTLMCRMKKLGINPYDYK
jgi:transcriptional regulator of acetoin/glycerol metabolism